MKVQQDFLAFKILEKEITLGTVTAIDPTSHAISLLFFPWFGRLVEA